MESSPEDPIFTSTEKNLYLTEFYLKELCICKYHPFQTNLIYIIQEKKIASCEKLYTKNKQVFYEHDNFLLQN